MGWQPLKRQGAARDIGNGALYFASDRSLQASGQALSGDGGLSAGDPGNLHSLGIDDSIDEPLAAPALAPVPAPKA